MHWDDSFYILEVFFTMFSVLQPAKTAELRQPGSFAHAVKIGGIYIYVYIYKLDVCMNIWCFKKRCMFNQ